MMMMTRPVPKTTPATATAMAPMPAPETVEVKVPALEEAPRNGCGS